MAYRDIIKDLNSTYYLSETIDGHQQIKINELNGIKYLENNQEILRELIGRCRVIGLDDDQLALLELYGPVILKRSRNLEDFLTKIERCLLEASNFTNSEKIVCSTVQSLEPFKYCGTSDELKLLTSIKDPRDFSYINDDGELVFPKICPEDWRQLCSLVRTCLLTNQIKNTNGSEIYKPLFPLSKSTFQYVSNPGDGDCLFMAVGQFLDLERQQKLDKDYIVKPETNILRYIAEILRFQTGNKLIQLRDSIFDYINIGNISTFKEHFNEDPHNKQIVERNWENYKRIINNYTNPDIKTNRLLEITLIETNGNKIEQDYLKYCVLMREHYPLSELGEEQDVDTAELYGGGPKVVIKPSSLSLWGSIYEVKALSQYLERDIIVYVATSNKDVIIPMTTAIYNNKPTIPITIFLRTSGGVGRHYETLWPSTLKPVYEKINGKWTKNTGSYVQRDTIKVSYLGPYAIFYGKKILNRSMVNESDLRYLQKFLGKDMGKLPANLIDYDKINCYKNPILVDASSKKEAELIDQGRMDGLIKEIGEKIEEKPYGNTIDYIEPDTVIELDEEIPDINIPIIPNKKDDEIRIRPEFIKVPLAPKRPKKPIGVKPNEGKSNGEEDWIELEVMGKKIGYNLSKIRKLPNSKDLIGKIEGLILGTKKCSSPDKIVNPISGSCVEITSSRIKEAVSMGLIRINST